MRAGVGIAAVGGPEAGSEPSEIGLLVGGSCWFGLWWLIIGENGKEQVGGYRIAESVRNSEESRDQDSNKFHGC